MKRIAAPLTALFLEKGLVQRSHRMDLGDWYVQLSSVSDVCLARLSIALSYVTLLQSLCLYSFVCTVG